MPIDGITDEDYARLRERCKALPAPRGNYPQQDFVSILMLTVLDYQLHNAVVDRAHSHFVRHHASLLQNIDSLAAFLSRYANDRQGNTEAATALWSYKHWTRLVQLRGLVAFFQSIQVTDLESLRKWAAAADFQRDFRGRIKGLGPAVFQWLVMRTGIETIKPDVHVLAFVSSAIGYRPSFETVVFVLTRISRELDVSPRQLDLSIWELQRGGPGRI